MLLSSNLPALTLEGAGVNPSLSPYAQPAAGYTGDVGIMATKGGDCMKASRARTAASSAPSAGLLLLASYAGRPLHSML
jgi:hypothetical protein